MPAVLRPAAAPRLLALLAGLAVLLVLAVAAPAVAATTGTTKATAAKKAAAKKAAAKRKAAAKKRRKAADRSVCAGRRVASTSTRRSRSTKGSAAARRRAARRRAAQRKAAERAARACALAKKPAAAKPAAAAAAKPAEPATAAKPVVAAKPAAAKPVAAKPVAAKPVAATPKPAASKPATPKPATPKPATPVVTTPSGSGVPVVRGAQDPAASRAITLGATVRGWRDGGAISQRFAEAKADGTRTTRVDVSWVDAEPQQGRFDLAAYDARFRVLAGQGLRAVVLLDGTAPWAGEDSDYGANPAGYARFVARIVARYGAGGSFWTENPQYDASLAPVWFELWNEPYLPGSANNRRSPDAYAKLVKGAVIAGRAANPNVKFMAAAETTVFDDVQGRWREWVTALFQSVPDLGRYVDGWAMHPYFGGDPSVYNPGTSAMHRQFLRLDDIRSQLRRAGVGEQPWFITEIGSATCRDRSSNYMCTTEAQQAQNFRTTMQYFRTRYADNVRAVLTYRNEDLDYGARGGDWDALGTFGMRRTDGSAKPILSSFQAAFTS